MAEVPRKSPVPSIVRQGNLEDAKAAGRFKGLKALSSFLRKLVKQTVGLIILWYYKQLYS
jgi:hypothetical protein